MTEHSIFRKETRAAVAASSAVYERQPYFIRNYSRCRELLLTEKDPEGAAEAVRFGIMHARLLHLDCYLLPIVYIDWMLPELLKDLKKQGIPDTVIMESLRDIEIWIQSYRKYHQGQVGLDRIEWVFRSLAGKVQRFGSLQFEKVTYEFPFLVLENRQSGKLQAMAYPDLVADQDGYFAGTNARKSVSIVKTELDYREGNLHGYCADLKRGTLNVEEKASYCLENWEVKLVPGEEAVAVHIPEGADLSPDSIDASLHAAKSYYENSILICESWMLDPHLELILPQTSRVVNFMHRFYKIPVMADRPQILERVMGFDFTMDKLLQFPCTTSLQSALKKYLSEGNEMFTTAGFMPWNDNTTGRNTGL